MRDIQNPRDVRCVLSRLAYTDVLDGFFIRPIVRPSDYVAPFGRPQSDWAEDIVRDGGEVVCINPTVLRQKPLPPVARAM